MKASALLLYATLLTSRSALADSTLEFINPPTVAMAGDNLSVHLSSAPDRDTLDLNWRIFIDTLSVARGEARLTRSSANDFQLVLKMPTLHENESVRMKLVVSQLGAPRPSRAADGRAEFWLLHPDPFVDLRKRLEQLKVCLFDPQSRTRTALSDARIPFQIVDTPDALGSRESGLIVVGSGTSFREWPTLSDHLRMKFSTGSSVVCLAPRDEPIPLPGVGAGGSDRPRSVRFVSHSVAHEYDKRLRGVRLGSLNQPSGIVLAPRGDLIVGAASASKDAWTWFEAHSEQTTHRFIVCGPDLISTWDSGPAPRYLLAAVLRSLLPVEPIDHHP